MSFQRPLAAGRVATPARTPAAPLRLTRRGRVVVVLLLALVAVTAFSLGRASSDASGAPAATRRSVVVQPGETLWEIARRAVPGADPRETVARIADLNDLSGSLVHPGQRLVVPG